MCSWTNLKYKYRYGTVHRSVVIEQMKRNRMGGSLGTVSNPNTQIATATAVLCVPASTMSKQIRSMVSVIDLYSRFNNCRA